MFISDADRLWTKIKWKTQKFSPRTSSGIERRQSIFAASESRWEPWPPSWSQLIARSRSRRKSSSLCQCCSDAWSKWTLWVLPAALAASSRCLRTWTWRRETWTPPSTTFTPRQSTIVRSWNSLPRCVTSRPWRPVAKLELEKAKFNPQQPSPLQLRPTMWTPCRPDSTS